MAGCGGGAIDLAMRDRNRALKYRRARAAPVVAAIRGIIGFNSTWVGNNLKWEGGCEKGIYLHNHTGVECMKIYP